MSAQRGNFHLPGHLRTAGGTPHFFEIGEKCEKTLQTPHLQSEAMSSEKPARMTPALRKIRKIRQIRKNREIRKTPVQYHTSVQNF